MSTITVEIEQGKLIGKVSKNHNDFQFYSFKGIPYAMPPVGDLRFAAPQLPQSWEGLRDATKNCNICVQFDIETKSIVGNEDCLYLNVYTPQVFQCTSSLLPVMVYIHGGGYQYLHGTDDTVHGPEYLIEKDVVVVGFNYRLGVLGFLSLDREEAPGNMGLKDQVQALKWVQRNICKFGGDPQNVTIFGISAGGASVEYHLISPMARGLFHKAIAQSGSSLSHWAQNKDIKKLASKIPMLQGKVLSENDSLLQYLKDLPVTDLISASMLAVQSDEHRGGIHFGFVPTIEESGNWETFLSESPYELISRGEFNKVPFMSGFCTREGLVIVSHGGDKIKSLLQEKCFVDHFPFELNAIEKVETEERLKAVYLDKPPTVEEPDAFAVDFFTDATALSGIYVAARLIANHSAPVYFYEFSYDGGLNYVKKLYKIDRKGACHADDGGYLLKSDIFNEKLSENDIMVREKFTKLWTNFAKYGNPTPENDTLFPIKWNPISEEKMACFVIDEPCVLKHEVYPERMEIYFEQFEKKRGFY